MSLSEAQLLDDVRQRLFSPVNSAIPRAIGAELELIPLHTDTRQPARIRDWERPGTAPLLSRLGKVHGWIEESSEDDPPSWKLPDGARVSFEPGGQLEFSSAPSPVASSLIVTMRALIETVREAMGANGIDLVARGVDPYNDIDAVPLQLHRDRYTGMTRYFDSIGPSGVRMMRQTAALQLNVERGTNPLGRWRLLNGLAPFVVALFANSAGYAGVRTEFASYRAQLWRTLDPSRTGIIYDGSDAPATYLDFALDAGAMQSSNGQRPYRTFRDWMRESAVGEDDWHFHLSTLFPEVRPREYFELRSADTIDIKWLAAPVTFLAGLVYDQIATKQANNLLGAPSDTLLVRAGQFGLADPEIRRIATSLVDLSLEAASRLGEDYLSRQHIDEAAEYFQVCKRLVS